MRQDRGGTRREGGEEQEVMKILIIDDSADARAVARARLGPEGHEILCAEGGGEGLQVAAQESPDLILLDVDMPNMSGFEVCRRLKSDQASRSIPVIFLTGSGGTADKVKGLNLGAVDYVSKPFDAFELRARVRAALRTKQLQDEVIKVAEELKRSNEDLGQFAYVASHDLQEPLRQVTGFMKLLRDRYRSKLDDEADEFIQYATDGASRMSDLIRGLLDYSRVGAPGKKPGAVSCQEALDRALADLDVAISDSGARVTHDALPTLVADKTQVLQLLQNLIGNALKFRREGVAPEIHIGARHEGGQWVLCVRDNGVGIPAEEFDRVFAIFHRLHDRQEYPGTGIGLAICKRIVERHGGRIWVESKVGVGTTFFFTL
jgi:two-component system, sensor histidine kinase and response regulator